MRPDRRRIGQAVAPGYINSKKRIQDRLSRLEGQVRGIHRMVDEERYCIDILTQVNAVKAAHDRVAVSLLDEHVRHCVKHAADMGDTEQNLKELSAAIGRFFGRMTRVDLTIRPCGHRRPTMPLAVVAATIPLALGLGAATLRRWSP